MGSGSQALSRAITILFSSDAPTPPLPHQADFRAAFDFLGPLAKKRGGAGRAVEGLLGRGLRSEAALKDGDMKVIRAIDSLLTATGTIKADPPEEGA